MKRDPLAALKHADPLRRVDLDAVVDHRAFDALREAIIMSPRSIPFPPRARRGRLIVATTAAIALLGGGVAYASYSSRFAGGANDGVTCMATFVDPDTIDWKNNPTFGGVRLTADPIADCATYAATSGKSTIKDPVAFRFKGYLVVAPSGQVPAGADRVAASDADAQLVVRLTQALDDPVDRPVPCMSVEQATSFARESLKGVGLRGWTVSERKSEASGACVSAMPDPTNKTIWLQPEPGADPSQRREDSTYAQLDAQTASLVTALRSGISQRCVSVGEAEQVAKTQAAQLDRVARSVFRDAPATAVIAETDGSQACSTVDVKPGGSFTIVVRGPQTAKP